MKLRFVTYNILLGIERGVGAVAEAIAAHKPDVVTMQEVGRRWRMGPSGDSTAEIAEQLALPYHRFVPSIDEDGAQYGHSLMTRLAVESSEWFRLPQDVDEPRTYLSTRLRVEDTTLRIFSTHLSHIEDRAVQGTVLVDEALGAQEDVVVVMGDLNALSDEAFLQRLFEDFADADAERQRLTYSVSNPRRRIDYLLVRGGSWSDTVVDRAGVASDHFLLASTLTI